MYVEAMLPAIKGYVPVVMDRSWLSEEPYGMVYRDGVRFDDVDCRMLERLALKCPVNVIHCDPGWKTISTLFKERKREEYLDDEDQLKQVWSRYKTRMSRTHLPVHRYDWTKSRVANNSLDLFLSTTNVYSHQLPGAGNPTAKILIVGDSFANHSEYDAHYQWPFASFGKQGCSRWLAAKLEQAKIPERELYWMNADMLDPELSSTIQDRFDYIFALGDQALSALCGGRAFNPADHIYEHPHPQWWKRFVGDKKPYPLIAALKEIT
jgi:hypothetical protein